MTRVLIVQAAAIVLLHHGGILVTEQGVFFDTHVLADEVALEQRDIA